MLYKSHLIVILCVLATALRRVHGSGEQEIQDSLPKVNGEHFYYFGYGSNMLTARIHRQNPTAKLIGMGRLKGYRLDFYGSGALWNGAPATIVPSNDSEVLGIVWNINLKNLPDIDRQEMVHEGVYTARSVPISLSNSTELVARVYLMVNQPTGELDLTLDTTPYNRQPSKTYLQCLVQGAKDNGISTEYVNWLKEIKHNGRISETMESALNLKEVELG